MKYKLKDSQTEYYDLVKIQGPLKKFVFGLRVPQSSLERFRIF